MADIKAKEMYDDIKKWAAQFDGQVILGGNSEWGIPIDEYNTLEKVRAVEGKFGLCFYSILNYRGTHYACLGNKGQRKEASQFLQTQFHGILMPFQKPIGWSECHDYVWKC